MKPQRITIPDLFSMWIGTVEAKLQRALLEREITWTKRNLELIDREIAEKLTAKRELQSKLMNLTMERRG